MKEITIIIPVYNVEEYLVECFESVLNQKIDKNKIEVIVVNDGSKDNSLAICQKYVTENNWVLIDQFNQGLSISRNNALNIANGEYIMFLDSDDYLSPDTTDIVLKYAKDNNLDMVIFQIESFNSSGKYGYYSNYLSEQRKIFTYQEKPEIIRAMSVCNKLFKKELIGNTRFIEKVTHEDNYFSLTMFLRANKIGTLPYKFYNRRIREGENLSIMQMLNVKTFNDLLKNYDLFINENNDKNLKFILNFQLKSAINYIITRIKREDQRIALSSLKSFINNNINLIKKNKLSYLKIYYKFYYQIASLFYAIKKHH